MHQLTNQELFNKLEQIINTVSRELKEEIKSIKNNINQEIKNLERKLEEIDDRIAFIERGRRKNNIVIFGLKTDQENLLKTTLSQLNRIFGSHLQEKDINNLYIIGKKDTVVVEFISYLQKEKIFRQLFKLKGTGISISNDLRPEDRKLNKILVKHLKEARAKNQKAYIKNFKLYVNGTPYTIEQLENPSDVNICMEHEPTIPPKNNSAPATPTIRQLYLEEAEEVFTENKATPNEETIERKPIHQSQPPTTPKNTQSNTKTGVSVTNRNINPSIQNKEARETRTLRNKKSIS